PYALTSIGNHLLNLPLGSHFLLTSLNLLTFPAKAFPNVSSGAGILAYPLVSHVFLPFFSAISLSIALAPLTNSFTHSLTKASFSVDFHLTASALLKCSPLLP